MMPTVSGAAAQPAAPRRRQGGAQGQQAQQTASGPRPAPAGPAGSGYSTPTTYQKGQPTPPGGTRVPPGAAGAPGAAAPAAPAASPVAAAGAQLKAKLQRSGPAAPASGRTRRARLRVARADPWSVLKVSFLLSIALGVVTIVGVSLLWMVLDAAGVFSSVGGTLKQATGSDTTTGGFDLQSYLSFGNVLTFTALIAVIDVVLLTALARLGSFIYNTAAGMTGGVELTLAEEE
jgi:hypothetical protein